MPEVSVIIAAWNAEGFITGALRAALAQTDVDLEVVVADDASTDGTGAVVAALRDPRVAYLRLERNGGPAAARNAAMAAATGDWLMVLDADDLIAPGRARRLLDAARDARADIVADNFRVASQKDPGRLELHIAEDLDGAPVTIALADYIRANLLFSGVKALGYLKPMFRREFLAEHALAYPSAMRIGEDYALVAEAMARGARYIRVRAADYTYVTREGSISHRLNAADLQAMIDFDRTFLAAHHDRLSPDEREAAEAHLDSLLDGAAFTAMIDGLKARRLPAVLFAALRRPSAIRHFSMPIRARLGLDAPRG